MGARSSWLPSTRWTSSPCERYAGGGGALLLAHRFSCHVADTETCVHARVALQTFATAVSGACMAIALRYAGTADRRARNLLLTQVRACDLLLDAVLQGRGL